LCAVIAPCFAKALREGKKESSTEAICIRAGWRSLAFGAVIGWPVLLFFISFTRLLNIFFVLLAWLEWKKPERRRKNFIRLGIDQDHAYAWSRTRMGGWRVAQLRSTHEYLYKKLRNE